MLHICLYLGNISQLIDTGILAWWIFEASHLEIFSWTFYRMLLQHSSPIRNVTNIVNFLIHPQSHDDTRTKLTCTILYYIFSIRISIHQRRNVCYATKHIRKVRSWINIPSVIYLFVEFHDWELFETLWIWTNRKKFFSIWVTFSQSDSNWTICHLSE